MPAPARQIPTGPRAPDRRLRGLVGYSMKRAYHMLQADAARVLDDLGLRITTFSALAVVCDNPDLRQSQLAEALSMERSNTVVIVDALEQADLIERRRVPSDRRSYALRVTPAGRKLCEEATIRLHAHEAEMLAGLDAGERETFIALLRKIDGFEAERNDNG
ncbi:MAG: MarR family winged helix-turn-helix transcriptional regulator [Pseudooceanicola sp.]